jgi:uncharacterized protein with GYD domain
MATFFLFGKYTSDAIKSMSATRTEKAGDLIKKYGGAIKSIYALVGEKDLVIIATFPEAAQAVKSSIALCKLTGISFTTSEAITVEDFDKMIVDI